MHCEIRILEYSVMEVAMGGSRSELMQFKVTPEERRIIEKRAKKEGTSTSNYIRGCVLMEMVLDGDFQAMKIVGAEVGRKVWQGLRKRADELEAYGAKEISAKVERG